MKQKILHATSASLLNTMLEEAREKGWEPIGPHQVVVTHVQNRFAGLQHKDSIYTVEYSQSIKKNDYPGYHD